MPRRCHTKSRRGCVQCKERHVKCDERRPTCSLCVRRGLSCIYVAPRPRKRPSSNGGSPKNNGSDRASSHSSGSDPDGFSRLPRLKEMSLFYQCCESTLPSISKDEKGGQFWEKVPQFAVTHDHVMDSLLALAALHLASEQVDRGEIPSWLETALTYQTHATTGLRQDLATNPQNIEASFICSSIILILVTAYPGICWDDAPTDPLSEILTLRSILSGAAFLWIQMVGPESGWLDDWVYREGNNRLVVARAKTILMKFRTLAPIIEANPGPNSQIYRETYTLLLRSLETWPSGQGSLVWPIRVSEEFMTLVQQGDWTALIFILFHGLDRHLSSQKWYARDSGKRLVHGVIRKFGTTIPLEWMDMVDWVGRVVEV
ncbi:hypothetical protein N7478_001620 [Penicillium angulare]|uniref:uncharacterized protein n=1 Tax=Penicillium angulare TaxID=116970 RepID=UPI00253FFEDC|nr:uncharacterized protein N7478_001620 [Penicillium angulare]KAJ5288590.1 hypothetical protein N7478_001620 [Penicillium angulare]